MTSHPIEFSEDLQDTLPAIRIGLSGAGVTRSAKAIRISYGGIEHYMDADVQCTVDLDPDQKGVHMSRFEEEVNEAIDAVLIGETAVAIEQLAEDIARRMVERQGAMRGTATIRARYPKERRTPVTDVATQEMYGLVGMASARQGQARRAVGVSAQGMNACPCAQGLVREQAEAALAADGFSADEIARIVARVPIATHNQRARGTLMGPRHERTREGGGGRAVSAWSGMSRKARCLSPSSGWPLCAARRTTCSWASASH